VATVTFRPVTPTAAEWQNGQIVGAVTAPASDAFGMRMNGA
jgi:hypothetical protein